MSDRPNANATDAPPLVERLEPRLLLSGQPLINEFMAINDTTLPDQNNDYSDWLEIHNPTASTVDLTGWYLTDDEDDLTQWQFPTTTLVSGDYLVVFASGKDRRTPGSEYHTNFSLGGSGEYLALVMPDGVTVAHEYVPEFPQQVVDISYGPGDEASVVDSLVGAGTSLRVLVPSDDSLGRTWTGGQAFDDSTWLAGDTSVGFDLASDYDGYIITDIEADMLGQATSSYIRFSFAVADVDDLTSLTLRMRYDDGFAAYLNGVEVARRNAVDPLTNVSAAEEEHPDAQAIVFEDIDVTAFLDELADGANVLAVHGLNEFLADDDFLIMPELLADRTVRGPDQYFLTPTPDGENVAGALGRVADTRFSVDRGFYDAPFDVEITTDTPGAEIRYTLNGTAPTATTGSVYAGPITISGQTALRAAAYKPGYVQTNVDTHTYVFLDDVLSQDGAGFPDNWGHSGADYEVDPDVVNNGLYSGTIRDDFQAIPTLSLVMDVDDWFASGGQGIYIQGEGLPRAVSAELIFADGSEDGFQIDCSVQIQGGSSTGRWKSDKLSMRLKFRDVYGATKLNYPLYGDGTTGSFDTLVLDARLNNVWTHPDSGQQVKGQYTRDQYVCDLQNAVGGYAPHGRKVHLYLNGLYWGVYGLHERPDESFASDYLGGDKDDYDVLKHNSSTVVNGSNSNYNAMFAVANAGLASEAQYQLIQEYLDVADFADYMLVNFFVGNTDWAHQNWYASRNVVDPAGRWRYHTWDAEHVLKGAGDNVTGRDNPGGPTHLHQKLRDNAEYRLLFADHVHRHLFNDGALTPAAAAAIYQNLLDEVDRAVVGESSRWGDNRRPTDPYTRNDEWAAQRNWLLGTYFPGRTNTVLNQLKGQNLYPDVDAPVFRINGAYQHGGEISAGDLLSMTAPAGTIYYTLDGTDPREVGGAISPDAVAYAAAVPLDESCRVKARVWDGSEWSALNEAVYVLDVLPTVRITEIMYNPADPTGDEIAAGFTNNDDFEFVELRNIGPDPVDLGGMRFSHGISFTFPDIELEANDYVVVVSNQAAFEARYDSFTGTIAGAYTGLLSNAGEGLRLQTCFAQVIHDFEYDDGWYAVTDGDGYSLTICDEQGDLGLWAQQAGWKASDFLGGTPGADDAGLVPGSVVISEALAHSDGGVGDWIELHNTTGEAIDVGGWFLSDTDDDLTLYEIPAGTTIPDGGYLVLSESGHFGGAFALSELGDDVYLTSSAGGAPGGYRRHVDFDASPQGKTFGRYIKTTGAADFTLLNSATFGAANNPDPFIGDLVINEVMYHPDDPEPPSSYDDEDFEFIELYNRSGGLLDLTEFYLASGIGFTFGWYDADDFGDEVWTLETGASATWEATGLAAATYDVYARWTVGDGEGGTRTLDSLAAYEIAYDGGSAIVQVDQNANAAGDGWVLLGSYAFDGPASVTLTRGTDEPEEWTIADQVKFVTGGSPTIVDNGEAGFSAEGSDVTSLAADGYVVVVKNRDAFEDRYGVGTAVVAGAYTGSLANGGERLRLYRETTPQAVSGYIPYVRVDHVRYDDRAPWPIEPDGEGAALNRRVAGEYGNDVDNWAASTAGGTPGAQNVYIDTSPPSVPANVAPEAVTSSRIDLTWVESVDPHSGVDYYVIYRDGFPLDTSPTAGYSDTDLDETVTYAYQVSAVNLDGYESGLSTAVDGTPRPSLQSGFATDEIHVTVTFGKPVGQATAEETGNYTIADELSQPVGVLNAVRQADQSKVSLTLSAALVEDVVYTLTVSNVADLAGNPVAPGSQALFSYTSADPNLLAWWTFDEGGGSLAGDATGNGYDAAITGTVDWRAGRVGTGALYFDGSTRATDSDADCLNGLSAVTVAMWIKSDQTGTDRGFFISHASSSDCVSLRYDAAGSYGGANSLVKVYFNTTQDDPQNEGSTGGQTTDWQHVAITWTSGEEILLYLDGGLEPYSFNTGVLGGTIANCPILRAGEGTKRQGWQGLIDDVRIYSVALDAQAVARLANLDPVAQNDGGYQVDDGQTLIVNAPAGVLANDDDPDSAPQALAAALVSDVAHGELTLNADGSFEYAADARYDGIDTFTYQAYDGLEYSNLATVTITVDDTTPPAVTVDRLTTEDTSPPLSGTVDDPDAAVTVTVDGDPYPATNHGDGTWTLADDTVDPLTPDTYDVAVVAMDPAGNPGYDGTTDELTIEIVPQVLGRYIFYNDSAWDGSDPAANADDDGAIAPSPSQASDPWLGKTALLPGGTATFQSYTSYSRGINGIIIDVANLPELSLTAADFEFRVGNDDTPSGWDLAPAPVEIAVREGAGEGGSDRVTIIWADNAIEKCWLQVTVKATASTGLAQADVFYWGNAIAETGNDPDNAYINSADRLATRANPHNFFDPAGIDDAYDFDRDKNVNSSDRLKARANTTNFFTALKLITAPVAPPAPQTLLFSVLVSSPPASSPLPSSALAASQGTETDPLTPPTAPLAVPANQPVLLHVPRRRHSSGPSGAVWTRALAAVPQREAEAGREAPAPLSLHVELVDILARSRRMAPLGPGWPGRTPR